VPRRIAFLIANQTFTPASGLDDLSGPQNDAAALQTVLEDPARGGFEVRSFLNQTRAVVLPALDEALGEAGGSDTMLLFYAGHGKLDNAGRLCLAMADTRASALYSTSIPATELRNLIGQSNCGQVVLLLDCCFSGAIGREFSRGSVADQLALTSQAQGLHVLTASTSYETARELEAEEGGVVMGKFTRAIVDGILSGTADHDQDGLISLSDLRQHVRQMVRGQTPQYWAHDAAGDPVIARAAPVESPVQKRLRRLGGWYAGDDIPDAVYVAITNALAGNADADLAVRAQRLLDNPDVTAEALVGAWKGLVRQKEERRKAEEDARLQAEAEAQRKAEETRLKAEAQHRAKEQLRLQAEADARRKAEAAQLETEAEKRRAGEEQAQKAEADARRKAAETEQQRYAEEDARPKTEAQFSDGNSRSSSERGRTWILVAGAVVAVAVAAIILRPTPAPLPPPPPQTAALTNPSAATLPPIPPAASPPDRASESKPTQTKPTAEQASGPPSAAPPAPVPPAQEVAVASPPANRTPPVRSSCTLVAFRPRPGVSPPAGTARIFVDTSVTTDQQRVLRSSLPDYGFTPGGPSLCAAVDAIAPSVSFPPAGKLPLDIAPRATIGTTVKVKLSAPEGSGKNLLLDLFNENGEVYHLFGPAPAVDQQVLWHVPPPAGQWMAVLLASDGALWQGWSRPAQDSALAFLPLVTRGLQSAGGSVVDIALIDVVAAPAAPAPRLKTAQPLRQSKCNGIESIKNKFQMGGSISDDERAILQACGK
jgi:hypothetical protein